MKLRIILILVLIYSSILTSGQQSTIVLNSTMTGTQNIVARDAVFMSPGFSYTATSGHSFDASINSQLQPPAYSTGSNIIDPDTRSLNTSLPVGTLPGGFNVNNYGAATYQIPIFISPGTVGMQPQISIVYNSLVNDGLLGKGLDIAGLSTIKRVPKTIYNDTIRVGVMLESSDRFALDSNRLILTSGTYGAANSEYKTELETFVLVTAKSTAGNGPQWFEVKTKDGRTLEYGNTADSRIEAYGSQTVYMWHLNRVKDQNGNYVDFVYNEVNGESYIDQIKYTGNITTQLEPYNTIKFNYDTRTDVNTHYVGGSSVPKTALLTSITMKAEDNKLVREYQFRYVYDFYTHLNEIVEYGSDHKYLNSTVVGWGSATSQFSSNNSFGNSTINNYYLGDFNGDGRTDFVVTERKTSYTSSDKWKLYLACSNGVAFRFINEGFLNSYFQGFTVADVDGDGKDELLWKNVIPSTYQCNPHPCEGDQNRSSGNGESGTDQVQPPPSDTCWDECTHYDVSFLNYSYNETTGLVRGDTNYDILFGIANPTIYPIPEDFDGDGKSDYLFLNSYQSFYCVRINGSNKSGMSFSTPSEVKIIDFDGDGRKEVLITGESSSYIFQYNSLTQQFSTIYTSTTFPTGYDRIFTGDFNGDGKTDILAYNNGWSLKFSTGTGFVTSSNTPSLINVDPGASLNDNNYYIADFNGDGKDDILEAFLSESASHLDVYYSQGGGIFEKEENSYSKSSIVQDYFNFGDFNGDTKKDLFFYDYSSASNLVNICFFHKDELSHLVSEITNGLNFKTKISYKRLNDSTSYYAANNGASFPVYNLNGAYYAVSKVETNGQGYFSSVNYLYEGARIHRQGKGFLGFSKLTTTDSFHDYKSLKTFEYNPTFYYSYLKKNETIQSSYNNDTINRITITDSVKCLGGKRIFPYEGQTISVDLLLKTVITATNKYDNYGNLTRSTAIFRNDEQGQVIEAVKSTTNQYNHYGNWGIANKLIQTIDSSTYTNQPVYVRKKEFTYDSYGNLMTEITDPGKTKAVTKTYSSFNDYGLPAQVTISASDVTSRTSSFVFDSKYRFITQTTNPAEHNSYKTYDPGTGNTQTETGVDGLITTYEYDGFGRLTETITPQSNHIYTSSLWDTDYSGGTYSLYWTKANAQGKPYTITYYDLLGRVVKSETEGQSGSVFQEKVYNPTGQVYLQSMPHLSNETVKWNYFTYDTYNRIKKDSTAAVYFQYSYSDKTTTILRKESTFKIIKKNSLGDVIHTELANSNSTDNTYYSNGQVKQIQAEGTTVSFYYNEYGQQDSVINTNSGRISYQYDAFGELTSQKDAKNQTYSFQYDVFGRVTTKTGPDGTTNYAYVTSGNGIEQPLTITGPNNISQSYTYDTYGHITQLTESIPGDQDFITGYSYDSWGNNISVTYPSGISINKIYDKGYLSEIKKSDNSSIWKVDNVNGSGQPLQFTLGSSSLRTYYTYDTYGNIVHKITGTMEQTDSIYASTGNLSGRYYKEVNSQNGLQEVFTYDNLDRLTNSHVTGKPAVHIGYDDAGNITSKSEVGTYNYMTNKVNTLENITDNYGSISTVAQDITYTTSNMTASITEAPYELQFVYGPGNQRIKTTLKENNQVIKTKYFSMDYEKEIAGSVTKHFHYIYSPYGLVAVIVKNEATENLYYTDIDHLGSIIGLINPDGSYAEHYSYDAWGRRRNPTDWSFDNVPVPTLIDRGYIGQEHLDEFNLINMNGRMYDPLLGRFASVDPVIQYPDNSQSFNGYGYCLNNPLKYSDPSGMLAMPGDIDNSMFDMSSYVTRNMPDFGLVYLPWSWGDRGGGGSVVGDPFDAMNSCLSTEHPYGGSWSSTSGTNYYSCDAEAFISGCITNQFYGYWGCREGAARSWSEAYSKYSASASISDTRFPEMIELDGRLNSLKQYFAIVVGETGTGEAEAAGIGSVIMNILRLKCWSVFDLNFTSEIGGHTKFNAIGEIIYNEIMSDTWDEIFDPDYIYASRIAGATDALIPGAKDYSYGAYFFNATEQLIHPENHRNCIGSNWNAYNNGTFVITQVIGGTTFFKYNYPKYKQHWP